MPVEVQRQEPMVSSNRSRDNELTKIAVLRRGDDERQSHRSADADEYQC